MENIGIMVTHRRPKYHANATFVRLSRQTDGAPGSPSRIFKELQRRSQEYRAMAYPRIELEVSSGDQSLKMDWEQRYKAHRNEISTRNTMLPGVNNQYHSIT